MSEARLPRRPVPIRLTAALLLAGFLLLTAGPVCGSASDVDPEGCCQRHGCQQATPSSKAVDGTSLRKHEACAKCDKRSYSSSDSARDCCQRGDLVYPVARAQSAYHASALILALAVVTIPTYNSLSSTGNARAQSGGAPPPLKIGCVALYTLHSVFRI